MTDAQVKMLLPDYLENNLPEAQMRDIEAHLSTSATCREELAYLNRIRNFIAGRPQSPAPGLWQNIGQHLILQDTQLAWKQFEWAGKRLLPLLAAAAVLIFAFLGNLNEKDTALTLEDYLKAQWDGPEVVMLSDADLSQDDVLYLLQSR